MNDYRISPHSKNSQQQSLTELLSEAKKDKKGLEQGIAIFQEKRDQQRKREKLLRQEIESLKHTLSSLQSNKCNSLAELQDMIQVLSALKRELFCDESEEYKREEFFPREWRREKGSTRSQRFASVPNVPSYGRNMYKGNPLGRTLYEDNEDYSSRRPSTTRAVRHYDRKKKPSVRNRRRSAPSNHAAPKVLEEVEDAAKAFLDILSQLTPKVMKALWRRSSQTEERGNVKLLNINRLGPFLHEVIVFAFMRDNPDKPVPPNHRTKPLVQILTLRLLPYVQSKKHINFEHFKMFPMWLKKRGNPSTGTNGRARNEIPADELEKRNGLKLGSRCYIWSVGGQVWYNCEVVKIKFDAQGEWLVVRYYNNSTWLEKEVQRFSPSLRFPKKPLKGDVSV